MVVDDPAIAREVARRVTEALSRFGVAGEVQFSRGWVTLHGMGPTVSVDAGGVLSLWDGLPEEARQRRVNDLARDLAAARRGQLGETPGAAGFAMPGWVPPVAAAVAMIAALYGAWLLYGEWARRHASPEKKPVIQDYDAYERERAERAARVCAATKSRVMRGAAVGPSDVEGWVVELALLRPATGPGLLDDPAVAGFIQPDPSGRHSRLSWSGSPTLAAIEGPDTAAALVESNLPETGSPLYRGMRLVLTGRYVVPYFHETLRQEYMKLARAVADAMGAEYAGIYARCADERSPHLGGWFRGPSPGGAVGALVYFMGTFADHPDVRGSVMIPEGATQVDRAFAFRNVINATAALKKARVMAMVGAEAGSITGTDGQPSSVAFPFRDANRASRASRAIARDLGIGESR